jgi:tRNA threonylcarbamoyladenosine biosynthesis protein TsaE
MKRVSHSIEETKKIAAEFARALLGGEVVALAGDLGTGKTTFVKGVADALGVMHVVRSPTFAILHAYQTNGPNIKHVVHVDAYRLKPGETRELGLDDWLGRADAVLLIEWPEKLEGIDKPTTTVRFSHGKKPDERFISF